MRTPKEAAAYMIERYGKDATIHCTYGIMNNEGSAAQYWQEVYAAIIEQQKLKPKGTRKCSHSPTR